MKKSDWSEDARADVRRIDRSTAMRIFTTIQRFAETGEGDVKQLKGESGEGSNLCEVLPHPRNQRCPPCSEPSFSTPET